MKKIFIILLCMFSANSLAQEVDYYWIATWQFAAYAPTATAACTAAYADAGVDPVHAQVTSDDFAKCLYTVGENGNTYGGYNALRYSCPAGYLFDYGPKECLLAPPPPPDCDEDEELVTFMVGIVIEEFCTPIYNYDDHECEDIAGYISDQQVCNDDRNECEAGGGTYGYVGFNGESDSAVCLPLEYADALPTCDIPTMVVIETGMNGTNYVCSSPDQHTDATEQDSPQEPELDTDNDGVPDSQDDDIDGDGILNGDDSDIDGDGIDNEDDLTPDGESDDSKVKGGGTCASRPTCSGDAIQCAILFQTWKSACEKQTEEIDTDPLADFASDTESIADEFWTGITSAGEGIDGASAITASEGLGATIMAIIPSATSCNGSFSFGSKGNLVVSCARLDQMKGILAWLFYAYTAFYIFQLATKPIEAK